MSPRKAAGALFLLAVIFRTLYVFVFPPGGTDHEMMHTAAQNLLSGHGLGFFEASAGDLSTVRFRAMHEWPPLAAWMLSVATAITGDGRLADFLLFGSGILLLLVVLRALMGVLQLGPRVQALLWILVVSNPEPFRNLGLTDLYGALFLLWSVLLCIRLLQQPAGSNRQVIVASLFFFLPAAFRYQYYPLIFLFPAFLLIAAWMGNRRLLFRQAWLSFSVVFFLLATQVAFLFQQSGSGAFIAKDATGFYPENLLWTYPFLVKSFINTSYLENTLIAWGGTWSLMIYYALLLFVTVFICTKLFQYLVRRLWQLRPAAAKAADAEEHWQQRLVPALANFLLMGVSLAVLLLLTVLSLRYDAQKTPEGAFGFTYVHESRYFLGSSLLLLLLVSRLLQEHPFRLPQLRLLPVRRLAIATLLVVNLSLFGKFLVNVSFGAVPSTGTAQLAERKKVEQTLLRLKEKNNLPIVVAASVKYFAYQPQPDVAVLQDYQEVLQSGVRTSQPVQLVLITRKQLSDAELKFIYQKGAVQVYAGNRCRLYHVIAGSNEQMAAR